MSGDFAAAVARFARDLAATGFAMDGGAAVAVSGGPDSLALLLLARAALPGRIAAATVDHGLRAEAAVEAAAVGALCRTLAVPHAILPVTVARRGRGVQAAARDVRYAALGGWMRGTGARWLLSAHHLDDRAETLLLRLRRGAGLAGLAAMRPAAPLPGMPELTLARPLLGWRRAELARIVADHGLAAVDDPANRDPAHDRTAARALLATTPWLDPERLAAAASHLADAADALDWTERRLWDERHAAALDGIDLDVADLPRELRRRLLMRAVTMLGEGPAPRGDALARLLDRLDAGQPGTLGPIKATPGPRWRIRSTPPHRHR